MRSRQDRRAISRITNHECTSMEHGTRNTDMKFEFVSHNHELRTRDSFNEHFGFLFLEIIYIRDYTDLRLPRQMLMRKTKV